MEQPICDPCWLLETGTFETDENGVSMLVWYRVPDPVPGNPLEKCCLCDAHTIAGIYIDKGLDEVPFPKLLAM